MVVEVISILLRSFGASAPIGASTQASDSKPIVIFVDASAKGLIYRVDGVPVSLFEIRRTLERKSDRSKPDREVVIVLHEDDFFAGGRSSSSDTSSRLR